jgi:hypothetical protein
VIVVEHGQSWGKQLDPPSVDPKDGFTTPREIPLPKMFVFGDLKVQTRTATQRRPQLILRTSNQPLPRLREHSSLNTIDIIGEVGCIGSYRMNELGYLRHAAETEFIYGECECAFLEQDGLDCVSNDREKLVKNELTDELLDWVGQQVDGLAAEIAEKRRQEKKSRDLVHSSLFNQMLDRWKNKFMATLSVELFGGSGLGSAFGGSGTGATGAGRGASDGGAKLDGDGEADDVKQPLGGEDAGHQGGDQGGSGEDRRKGAKFPTVLISGLDRDPFDPDASAPFDCDERHPPVYQRQVDIDRGVYWINTSRPLANKILNLYGADHPRWREYLFQRYVEIILKQQIYSLQRHEAEFTAEQVDSLIDRVTAMVHDAAAEELEGFLFDETLTGAAAAQSFDATEGEDDDAN